MSDDEDDTCTFGTALPKLPDGIYNDIIIEKAPKI